MSLEETIKKGLEMLKDPKDVAQAMADAISKISQLEMELSRMHKLLTRRAALPFKLRLVEYSQNLNGYTMHFDLLDAAWDEVRNVVICKSESHPPPLGTTYVLLTE